MSLITLDNRGRHNRQQAWLYVTPECTECGDRHDDNLPCEYDAPIASLFDRY